MKKISVLTLLSMLAVPAFAEEAPVIDTDIAETTAVEEVVADTVDASVT